MAEVGCGPRSVTEYCALGHHQPVASPASPPRLLIILNRRAARKRFRRFREVLALLEDAGCAYNILEINGDGDAGRHVATVAPESIDVIAIAGGDGTINDAINGVRPETPPLGLIPLGTANVLAHEIGLGTDPRRVAEVLLAGGRMAVVPGQVNGRRFMMMASAGFDAHVVQGVSGGLKRRIGKIVYAFSALCQLARYSCPHLEVRVDGVPVMAATVVVSRGRLYGGRFVMAPDAALGAAELHVSLFRRRGRLAMAGYSAALPLGLLNRWNLIGHVTAQCVEVSLRQGDPVQVDGDVMAALPARFDLAEVPIQLVVPPEAGATTKITCREKSYGA